MPGKQHLIGEPGHPTNDNHHYPARPIAETLTNGFFTVDNTWTVQYWNKAAEKILKVPATDIIGNNLWQKFEGIIPIELFSVDQRAFLKDKPVHFHEYWGEMGAWFDVITYHCDNTLSVSFKSSKQPHAQLSDSPVEQLKTLTELYRFVTEITNDCLWEWNLLTHEIFWIDGGHKRIFGYQVENTLIPQSFWEQCIHPEDKQQVLQSLKNTLAKKLSVKWEINYRFKASNGNYLYVHDRGHLIRGEDGKVIRIIEPPKTSPKNIAGSKTRKPAVSQAKKK
ncbi:MAG: PAS domain-containing protein [Chitinophagaceae bacterium]|nr:PAS domain-containing protein [Chitinophagaceae bacterium]